MLLGKSAYRPLPIIGPEPTKSATSSFLGIKKNMAVHAYFRAKTLETTDSDLQQLSCCYILVSMAIGQCCGTES